MAAHRYWRATAFEAYGAADLEMSAFYLIVAGVRGDAAATLTANTTPDVSGALANLQDADLTTAARWSAQSVQTLALQWDFGGSPVDVGTIQLASLSEWRSLLIARLDYSDDATAWTTATVYAGITWPGAYTLSDKLGSSVDPNALKVAALLHFDGADGGTVFTDETGTVWTAVGTPKIKTAQSKFGGSSLYCDQSGYLLADNNARYDPGAGDFTVECWVYQTDASAGTNFYGNNYQNLVGECQIGTPANGSFNLYLRQGKPMASVYDVGGTADMSIMSADALPLNTWRHLAYVRHGTSLDLYVNGVLKASGSFSGGIGVSTRKLAIGADSIGSARFSGYMDDVRLTIGTARYTGAFTPPDQPHPSIAIQGLNRISGRVAPADVMSIGDGPVMTYGTPRISTPVQLRVEDGFPDRITGVLGQGVGRVHGTVKITPATPTHRKVRLFREHDGLLMREQWSDPTTGEYDFRFVDELQTYTVVSYDYTGAYRAVVADNIIPEMLP